MSRAVALCAPLLTCAVLLAGCTTDACDQPLPCAEGNPAERFAVCAMITCTPVDGPSGVTAVRCWQATAHRTETPEGSAWSDGDRFAACDRGGRLRAAGRVDGAGTPRCADRCEPGYCPEPHGRPLPACEDP